MLSDSSAVDDPREQIADQQEPQAGPSTNPTARSNDTKEAASRKVGVSSTPDTIASRKLALRMRRLELDRLQFKTEKARKELEFEERELEIARQVVLQDADSPNQMEKAVAWLTDTDRVGMATGAQRDGGDIGYRRSIHPSFTPTGSRASVPPIYDPTWMYDQRAAQEQEYVAWRCAVENSFTKDRETHHPRRHHVESNDIQNGGPHRVSSSLNTGIGNTVLNQSHGNARQAIETELPTFSGTVTEWPIFYAHFKRSSAACGFAEEENLLRLQRALRGPALEAVEDLLLLPNSLEETLSVLEAEFGRAELIVDSMIEKVRRMPAPRIEKLETMAAFGSAVRKMCAAIRVSGLRDYQCNVALLKELSAKLPPTSRLEWGRYKLRLPEVTLMEFGKWIAEVGAGAAAFIYVNVKDPAMMIWPKP
uniref:Uncharacterized protein n=1 Tax=Anopheles epiroticus TaxID=199890 RepID=A0A182PYU0_9DIPT